MSTLSDVLLNLVKPSIVKGMAALGLSSVSVVGVQSVFESVKNQLVSSIATGDYAMLQLAGLAGVWDALGMVLAAGVFAVTYWSISKSVQILGVL